MPPRNAKPKCSNCPKPPAKAEAVQLPSLQITSVSEGERLWNHVLFGTGTCANMIRGYAELNMPGCPVERIRELAKHLNETLRIISA